MKSTLKTKKIAKIGKKKFRMSKNQVSKQQQKQNNDKDVQVSVDSIVEPPTPFFGCSCWCHDIPSPIAASTPKVSINRSTTSFVGDQLISTANKFSIVVVEDQGVITYEQFINKGTITSLPVDKSIIPINESSSSLNASDFMRDNASLDGLSELIFADQL